MSARRSQDGGGFIVGKHAANEDDFISSPAAPSGASWKDPMQLRVVYPADIPEVLSAVEDLWLRIARHHAVRTAVLRDESTGERLVMFRFNGDGSDSECCQLLAAATSYESYWWRQDESKGSLVSDIQWEGNTLAIELTLMNQIRRWPEGDAVDWAMQSLLQRVRNQGRRE
jgi:hypothetical protein